MSNPARGWHWLIQRLALESGFRLVYPMLSRLPARLGLAGARVWGLWMAALDCEWRSVALRDHFVSRKTHLAVQATNLGLAADSFAPLIAERFACACQEEMEGHWLGRGIESPLPVEMEGVGPLQAVLASGRGLVLLTFHFDAAIWGIGCLGRAGLCLSPVSSRIVEDARVPACVRSYFQHKYAGLGRLLNGGKVMHSEGSMKDFFRRLRRGEGVVVLADAFSHDGEGVLRTDFLGRRTAFAPGAFRLASRTGAAVAAFVCLRVDGGYRVVASPPSGPGEDAESACRTALAFLESHVRTFPARWWAADLLADVRSP